METPAHVPLGDDSGETRGPTPVSRPDVSVIVVSYNTREFLRRCLATLKTSDTSRPFETIVVDNASSDDSVGLVKDEFPEVRVLANRENVGYSRAVNQAIQNASGRYVLILNPDIEVLPGSIDALARHMDEHAETGIAGGKLLNPDGTLQYSCRTFYTLKTLLYRRTPLGKIFPDSRVVRDHLMMDWDHDSVREVDWMLGACLMVRTEAIREVGFMDERFFMYFEDVDWCYRMKQHGWKVVYVPDAPMKHVHRRESAKKGGFFNTRLLAHLNSMFRFFDKWNTLLYRVRKHRDTMRSAAHLLGDVVAINLAFVAAWFLRSELIAILERPVFPLVSYKPFVLLMNGVVLFANAMFGLYRSASSRDLLDDAVDLLKALTIATLVLMASTFLTRSELHSRLMIGMFVPFAFVGILAGRALVSSGLHRLRRHRFDLVRVVVLGQTDAATELAQKLDERPELGYDVVTTLSDRPQEGERRFREFWDAEGIREIIHRHRVGEVLLVRPTISERELSRLILLCHRDGVRVRLVSGAADFLPGNADVAELLGRPTVDLSSLRSRATSGFAHRALDLVVASLGVALLTPWAALSGRKDDSHPREEIYGYRGARFSREAPGPRRRLLTSLLHVLRGEMALVGPRPVSPEEVASREELRVLFDLVRPGLTGTWRQTPGLSKEEEFSLSLSYLQNRTLLEDVKTILRTLALRFHPASKRMKH